MSRSALARRRRVPKSLTRRAEQDFLTYFGLVTQDTDELVDNNVLIYATDNRIPKRGRNKTRRGNDFYSVPIGESIDDSEVSTTGAGTTTFNSATWIAQKFTATTTGERITKVEVNLSNFTGTGVPLISIYDDDGGSPGTELATSSYQSSDITGTAQYLEARFIEAPEVTAATDYWIVLRVQDGGTSSYRSGTTTNSTDAKYSTDSGGTWSTFGIGLSLNYKLYTSDAGGVKGVYRTYRQGSSPLTVFEHGDSVYSVNDTTGATTLIKSGLNASATHYRHAMANDTLYYVNGQQKPRKYDFTTETEVTAAPGDAHIIIEHKGYMFYGDASDKSKIFFSDFADFDAFTSTNFIHIPAPKTPDPITGFAKLNGVLYIYKKANKFALYGSNPASFALDEAPGQRGAVSQEAIAYDDNFIYSATEEGVFKFNGTEEINITRDILDDYRSLLSKDDIVLELHNNRLFVWYTPNGESLNTRCFVFNTLYGVWESVDTGECIGRAFARHDVGDAFIKASNVAGVLYYGERDSNDYHNLGKPLEWEIRTKFDDFGRPESLKQITYFRPRLLKQSAYSVDINYATNFSVAQNLLESVNLQGANLVYKTGGGALYQTGSGLKYQTSSGLISLTSDLSVPGEAKWWQFIYKHTAAREPVELRGHTLTSHTRRMR